MDPWAVIAAESMTWACEPAALDGVAAVLSGLPGGALQTVAGDFALQPVARDGQSANLTHVIPVVGPLVNRTSPLSRMLGLSTYQGIRQELSDAARNRAVSRIVLYVDSPGGSTVGVEEVAADIRAAASVKPVVSYVAGMAASAAYWIASASDRIVSTVSGDVGSIGVWGLHVDMSKALDRAGIKPTFVVSRQSPHKVENNPLEPLSRDAKAYAQSQVDTVAAKFIRSVAAGRSTSQATVIRDYGGGRLMFAEMALARGMIDGIDNDLARVASGAPPARTSVTARRAELALLEHG